MKLTAFTVNTRDSKGKGPAGRSRHAGNIPGIVYGDGKENVNVVVDQKSFDHLIHKGQGEHSLVDLTVSDNPDLNGPAIIRDVQHHPVSGMALHFDLLRIDLNKPIITQVPVSLEGRSIGIIEGGVLDFQFRELEVECLPLDVPAEIVGDITHLNIGDTYHVSDLPPNDKITILTDANRTIAAIHQPRVATETTTDAAVAEVGVVGEEDSEATEDAAE